MEKIELSLQNISKIAMFTDIHWGAKQNSSQHNDDCTEFVDWFLMQCKEQQVDAIAFLGDWFENRNALNVLTINSATSALRKLNDFGVPIFFITGNHDLYYRHNRDIHSLDMFREYSNINVIDKLLKCNDMLFVPFIFKDEYPAVVNDINNSKYVFGHFEFRNFYLTGTNTKSEHGFHHKILDGPIHVFSGHFHKRQANDNVVYIGNPFGTNFADAGDFDRGFSILNTESSEVEFFNYDGPTYVKTTVSALANGEVELRAKARVKALINLDMSYSEAQSFKKEVIELFGLRELSLEENAKERQESIEDSMAELEDLDLGTLDETVKNLIGMGVQATTTINPVYLEQLYDELR
jgi:DNA repair exonuclease SbcCD nuclease subunit